MSNSPQDLAQFRDSLLPDRLRPRLTPPARALARALLRHAGATVVGTAGHVAWRARHPAARERYLEEGAPPKLREYWYTSEDGWRAPMRYLAPRAGGAGEPVVLAHAVGAGADAFRYGTGPTLASTLTEAGFAVFLLAHRGDRAAIGPAGPTPTDFDAILERDVPNALARVQEVSGFPRAHWVGHGLGGQLGLAAAAAHMPGIATVTGLAAPARFPAARTAGRRAALAAALLPAGWPLPVRWMARFAAPVLGPDTWGSPFAADSPGARVRGLATHAAEDVTLGLVQQLAEWVATGTWSSRAGIVDRLETMRHGDVPLLALCGDTDPVCTVEAARVAVERWGHADKAFRVLGGFSHLDALLGARALGEVFTPLVAWLNHRRRLSWGPGFAESVGP